MMNEQEKIYQENTQEPRIKQQDVLMELQSALQDYFVAEVKEMKGELWMQFPNGQRFALTIKEI